MKENRNADLRASPPTTQAGNEEQFERVVEALGTGGRAREKASDSKL